MSYAVISVIGRDRPGFVHELATMASARGLNIEDSRATSLGGEFAVMMSLSGDEDAIRQLEAALGVLADSQNLDFVLRSTEAATTSADLQLVQVTVTCMDHPGIVEAVTAFFADRSANITDLNTATHPAPHTGTPMFDLQMIVALGEQDSLADHAQAFETFCESQDLDASWQPLAE